MNAKLRAVLDDALNHFSAFLRLKPTYGQGFTDSLLLNVDNQNGFVDDLW
jgi:hypothetical protein